MFILRDYTIFCSAALNLLVCSMQYVILPRVVPLECLIRVAHPFFQWVGASFSATG